MFLTLNKSLSGFTFVQCFVQCSVFVSEYNGLCKRYRKKWTNGIFQGKYLSYGSNIMHIHKNAS